MIIINRDIIRAIFGDFVANNIEMIIVVLGIIILAITIFKNDWLRNAIKRENRRFEASRPEQAKPTSRPDQERTWYPTGWTWNDETKRWEPPDYLVDECHSRWRWDEEKEIWVDKVKEAKMAKYKEYRKGKEPTYEEWKAAKLAEQNKTPEE